MATRNLGRTWGERRFKPEASALGLMRAVNGGSVEVSAPLANRQPVTLT